VNKRAGWDVSDRNISSPCRESNKVLSVVIFFFLLHYVNRTLLQETYWYIKLHLADRNVASCGKCSMFYRKRKGKLIRQMKLMAKFNRIGKDNARRFINNEKNNHYFDLKMQN
jgi:hypothetical protein